MFPSSFIIPLGWFKVFFAVPCWTCVVKTMFLFTVSDSKSEEWFPWNRAITLWSTGQCWTSWWRWHINCWNCTQKWPFCDRDLAHMREKDDIKCLLLSEFDRWRQQWSAWTKSYSLPLFKEGNHRNKHWVLVGQVLRFKFNQVCCISYERSV